MARSGRIASPKSCSRGWIRRARVKSQAPNPKSQPLPTPKTQRTSKLQNPNQTPQPSERLAPWPLGFGPWDLALGFGLGIWPWDLEVGSGWDLELGAWDLTRVLPSLCYRPPPCP